MPIQVSIDLDPTTISGAAIHASLSTRPLTLADVPAVSRILAQLERAEPAQMHWDEAELVEMFQGPSADLENGSVGVLAATGPHGTQELIAFGLLDTMAGTGIVRFMLFGGVATDWTRRGLGRSVIRIQLAEAAALAAEHHPGTPADARLWLAQGREGVAALARSEGFVPERWYFDMRRELADLPEAPSPPDGVGFVEWSEDLDEQVREASNAAFADHWGSLPRDRERWRAEYTTSSMFRPQASLLAVRDGRVVSFVLVEEFVGETRENGFTTAYIARVGSLREERGRGVASALLTSVLHRCRDRGFRLAELTVDADSPTGAGRLYERLGFIQIRRSAVAGRALTP